MIRLFGITILVLGFNFSFQSCSKSFHCTCTDDFHTVDTIIYDVKKDDAWIFCSDFETEIEDTSTLDYGCTVYEAEK